ncbi:MAG: hypothetical protein MRZ27_09030, partial [Eubacteriaceae bacterium]|nr:hypothetical protein [Eubacteriaceae bacterium]
KSEHCKNPVFGCCKSTVKISYLRRLQKYSRSDIIGRTGLRPLNRLYLRVFYAKKYFRTNWRKK